MKSLLIFAFGLFAAFSSSADLIGVVQSGSSSHIDLFSEAGVCLGDARRAEYVPDRGPPIAGCWVLTNNPNKVFVVFFDGDYASVPVIGIVPPKKL